MNKADVQIGRQNSNKPPFLEYVIEIKDHASGTFIAVKMQPEHFAGAVTGLVSKCEYEISKMGRD